MGLTMLTLLLSLGHAQTATTGVLAGAVADEDALPLSSVVVTVSSDNLIGGPRAVETDREGRYRVEGLPPGEYVLAAEREALQGRRVEGVVVSVGRVTSIHVELAPAAEAPRLPQDRRPVVDLQSADHGTTLDRSTLQRLPIR